MVHFYKAKILKFIYLLKLCLISSFRSKLIIFVKLSQIKLLIILYCIVRLSKILLLIYQHYRILFIYISIHNLYNKFKKEENHIFIPFVIEYTL